MTMTLSVTETPVRTWRAVCLLDDILPWTGVCALIDQRQIAIFRHGEALFALGNWDPIGRAFVMSRGILGSANGIPKVASPLYKQSYDLRTGQCLDDPVVTVPVFAVRAVEGRVELLV